MQIADDTPTIFSVPTRDAVETISAPKEEIPLPCTGFSLRTRSVSTKRRICGNPMRIDRNRPAATKKNGTMKGW